MYKFAHVRTSGTALDGTAAGKRQTIGSGGAGGAWVIETKIWGWSCLCGAGGWTNWGTKTFAEEINGAGGEWGNRLTLFAAGLLACSGSACGGEWSKTQCWWD